MPYCIKNYKANIIVDFFASIEQPARTDCFVGILKSSLRF
ncbi:hypothetical protein TREVI0001_1167 [Treponema vincentii ATCC 35580]|uniref:Uncharacterized protein n=1 Tax=Treponema vincentii ATCC 35580 TaxID=596324 RepID=C8PS03_9SPIR|nr:hypothetical protein TREVI0001_1167 [Treponema vincentii ATCC 35580]